MEIRIGVTNTPREITFDCTDSADKITQSVQSAFDHNSPLIQLSDSKGNVYLIPTQSLAYLEIGAEKSRQIGFVG